MPRYRRLKPPSPFRCAKALYLTAVAVIVLWFWQSVMDVVCRLSSYSCDVIMPEPLLWILGAMICSGLFYFSYRVYRDFYCGDYYLDLSQHY